MRRETLWQALVVTLLLIIAAVPASATFTPASCSDVAAWVAQHLDELPQTLADFETVPEGYEPGVFKALPSELRNELWTAFLEDYVRAQPELDAEAAQDVRAFSAYFERPTEFTDLDDASHRLIETLLASFTLRLVDPIADLVVESESLGQTAALCNCNRFSDPGCQAVFCTFTQSGCGYSTMDPCTGRF